MKNQFEVKVTSFEEIVEIEGARSIADYTALLEMAEFEDVSSLMEEEKLEMLYMTLQDMGPTKAAEFILRNDFEGILSSGQIQNISHEMLDEKLWEEYSDLGLHERFFTAASLLYKAMPLKFPKTDAVKLELEITASNEHAKELVSADLDESFLVRIVADGMGDQAILHRMFDDQIKSKKFSESKSIIWIVKSKLVSETTVKVSLISSGHWLDSLIDVTEFQSAAYSDDQSPN